MSVVCLVVCVCVCVSALAVLLLLFARAHLPLPSRLARERQSVASFRTPVLNAAAFHANDSSAAPAHIAVDFLPFRIAADVLLHAIRLCHYHVPAVPSCCW